MIDDALQKNRTANIIIKIDHLPIVPGTVITMKTIFNVINDIVKS